MRQILTFIILLVSLTSASAQDEPIEPSSQLLSGIHASVQLSDTIQYSDTTEIVAFRDSRHDFQDVYDNDKHKKHQLFHHNDTIWKDYAMGTRVHLQRLSDGDTLVTSDKSLIKPVVESLGVNFMVWGYDRFLQKEGWAAVNAHTIHHNLKCKWILDHDSYSGNQFSHPFHGSMFYNTARYHGHSY